MLASGAHTTSQSTGTGLRYLLARVVVALVIFQLIGGIGGQLQVALFRDELVPSVATGKVMLVLLTLLPWLFYRRMLINRGALALTITVLAVVLLLASSLWWLSVGESQDLWSVLGAYFVYYLYLLTLPLILPMIGLIQAKWMQRLVFSIGVPVALLGLAQYWLQTPIVATDGSDGGFSVQSWEFYGQVRGFSLGVSPYDIGFFLTLLFTTALAASYWGRRFQVLPIMLALLAGLALYATLTRNVVLEAGYALVTVILVAVLGRRRMLLLPLPFIYGSINLYLVYLKGSNALGQNEYAGSSLGNTDTLSVRLSQWGYFINDLRHQSDGALLLGRGIVQASHQGLTSVLLDNTFLALVANVGLLGLVGVCTLLFVLWWVALKRASEAPLLLGIAAILSTSFAVGMFNIAIGVYGLLGLLLLLICIGRPAGEDLKNNSSNF